MMADSIAVVLGAGLPPTSLFLAWLWCEWTKKRGNG